MHELDRHVARVRARHRIGAEGDEPAPAREALGHSMTQPRDPLGLGVEERPACRPPALRGRGGEGKRLTVTPSRGRVRG